ncbi:MAG: DUF1624 domain-containing protein [Verrucomicrobia bacterium]|nr:DUF1624 domain-containing protein [Verrucomicrobiota bacterium]
MSSTTRRLAWIDVLRGLAVVGMIETHVINAFLDKSYDSARWLHELKYYDGLIAPGFFWIAGYVQGLAIRRLHRDGKTVVTRSRLQRLGLIALVGYLLHVPWDHWMSGDFSAESWCILLQTDVLQCLAVSLVIIMFIGQLKRIWFDPVLLLMALIVVGLAPCAAGWHTGFMPLDAWLNHDAGSLFPLFPWFAFAAAGALASRCEPRAVLYVPLGIAFILSGYVFAPQHFLYQHPAFFMERLGYLLIIAWLVMRVSAWLAPRWLQLAGRESLLVYVAHLVIIYSLPMGGVPLDQRIGRTLSLPAVAFTFVALLAVCLGLAWLNERRKARAQINRT